MNWTEWTVVGILFAVAGLTAFALGWVFRGPTGGAIALLIFALAVVGFQLDEWGPK